MSILKVFKGYQRGENKTATSPSKISEETETSRQHKLSKNRKTTTTTTMEKTTTSLLTDTMQDIPHMIEGIEEKRILLEFIRWYMCGIVQSVNM